MQILLAKEIGCSWGHNIQAPWNVRRAFLVIQKSKADTGGWYFSWATEEDFKQCALPEWTAKALVHACPR